MVCNVDASLHPSIPSIYLQIKMLVQSKAIRVYTCAAENPFFLLVEVVLEISHTMTSTRHANIHNNISDKWLMITKDKAKMRKQDTVLCDLPGIQKVIVV